MRHYLEREEFVVQHVVNVDKDLFSSVTPTNFCLWIIESVARSQKFFVFDEVRLMYVGFKDDIMGNAPLFFHFDAFQNSGTNNKKEKC